MPGPNGILDRGADPSTPTRRQQVALGTPLGSYVSPQSGCGGTIKADALQVQAWETLELHTFAGGDVALRAPNGQYFGADGDQVRVDRASVGKNERFQLVDLGGGSVRLRAANGKYMHMVGFGAGIDVSATQPATAERFSIARVRDPWDWERVDARSPVVMNSAPAVARSGSRIDVFFRGTDNALYYKRFDSLHWHSAVKIGGNVAGAIGAVAQGSSGIIRAYYRADNASIRGCANDGITTEWNLWSQLGGVLGSGPAAASGSGGNVDVFAVNSEGGISQTYLWQGAWTPWTSRGAPSGKRFSSPPAAFDTASGAHHVYCRADGGGIWQLVHAGGWGAWTLVGGLATSGPAAVSVADGKVDLFVRGGDGGLAHVAFRDGAWGSWRRLGGALTSAPSVLVIDDVAHVYARAHDNSLILKRVALT